MLGGTGTEARGCGRGYPDLARVPLQAGHTPGHRVTSQRGLHQAAACPSQLEHQKVESCSATPFPAATPTHDNADVSQFDIKKDPFLFFLLLYPFLAG